MSPHRRRSVTGILLLLSALLVSGLISAASGQETESGDKHLGLPACQHALQAPKGKSLNLMPQAEKTCTNAPEPSDRPAPSDKSSPAEEPSGRPTASEEPTNTPKGQTETYLLTGTWQHYDKEPKGAVVVITPGQEPQYLPQPSFHVRAIVQVERIPGHKIRVALSIYPRNSKDRSPNAYADCQIYRVNPDHPTPSAAGKVGRNSGKSGQAFCITD